MTKKIGFDIGGNGVQYIIDNKIHEFSVINQDKDYVINQMCKIMEQHQINNVGISSPCAVNQQTGYLSGLSGIKNWSNFNIYDEIKKKIKINKIAAVNDANAALLGMVKTSSQKYQNAIMITIGTGIGGALFLNGKLFSGTNGYAGEFGYSLPFDILKLNNVSTICSANALVNRINDFFGKKEFRNAKEVLNSHNSLVIKRVNKWFTNVAKLIINLWYTIDPEVIFIAGGVTKYEHFTSKINIAVKKLLTKNGYDYEPNIKVSHLENAGLIGALSLLD